MRDRDNAGGAMMLISNCQVWDDDEMNERVATFLCDRIIIKSVNLPTAQYHLFVEMVDDDRVRRWDYSPCDGF